MEDEICERCGADKQVFYDTFGEPCCVEHGQRLIKGIGGDQYDAWQSLDSEFCMESRLHLSPLPHQTIGVN